MVASLIRKYIKLLFSILFVAFPVFPQVGGISGKVVYVKDNQVRVHQLGDSAYVELGRGDFARWSPNGNQVAVKDGSTIYVVNADGTNRINLANNAEEDKNCPLEFHTNGNEVLYIVDDKVIAVDIILQEQRLLMDFVDCTGEIGMSAEQNRLVCRDGHILRAIDLDTRTHIEYHDDNCSAGISPDGQYITYNDNGKPHHLNVFVNRLNRTNTSSKLYRTISHSVMPGETMGDNHHWSNHPDWITCEGDKKRKGVPFMINVKTQEGFVMVEVEDTVYPDLWVDY